MHNSYIDAAVKAARSGGRQVITFGGRKKETKLSTSCTRGGILLICSDSPGPAALRRSDGTITERQQPPAHFRFVSFETSALLFLLLL